MNATLTFNLNEPEDERSHMQCIKAKDLTMAIDDYRIWLKTQIDHGDYDEKTIYGFRRCMENLQDQLVERDVNLDELVGI